MSPRTRKFLQALTLAIAPSIVSAAAAILTAPKATQAPATQIVINCDRAYSCAGAIETAAARR